MPFKIIPFKYKRTTAEQFLIALKRLKYFWAGNKHNGPTLYLTFRDEFSAKTVMSYLLQTAGVERYDMAVFLRDTLPELFEKKPPKDKGDVIPEEVEK